MENVPTMLPAVPVNGLDTDEMSTQPITQSTQPISEPDCDQSNNHLWGFLLPCSQKLHQIDFWKIRPSVTLGRASDNMVQLPGRRISNKHCVFRWDGTEQGSPVVVLDMSTNGTFINGKKIGKGQSMLLHNGNEIAFGTSTPQVQDGGIEDYRFVFRFTAAGPARDGLWAYYDISHELGTGSFATVHKAISRRTGEWVAVKIIRSNKLASLNNNNADGHSVNANANANARANTHAREIQILQDLSHPNICKLIESFWTETEISLVLELVEGGDLLDYILKRGGLNETYARYITYQLCDALAYIHGQGVAHRDLKPENVLLSSDDPPIVKVADFGLAKYIDSLTMLRTMCGTPSYLAPEVVQNNESGYGYVVDSWSVGVIVFSMLTVSSPFVENEEIDLRSRIETRTTEWSLLTSKNFSRDAQDFIRRLLDEHPGTRMTAEESLCHPWLTGTGDDLKTMRANQQNGRQPPRSPAARQPLSQPVVNASMAEESLLSLGSHEVSIGGIATNGQAVPQDMSLDRRGSDGVAGAFYNANGSGRYTLQRRSRVIADAEANGRRLPEPSIEMLAQAASQSLLIGNPNELKRKAETSKQNGESDSSLTPLPEERDNENDDSMGVGSEQERPPPVVRRSKRGRNSDDPQTPQRAGRRRRSAPVTKVKSSRATDEPIDEEDEVMRDSPARDNAMSGVRRSPRNIRNR